MLDQTTFRPTTTPDRPGILSLYPQAFPEEDLTPLVAALLPDTEHVFSLGGYQGDGLVAHVLFSICDTVPGGPKGALLGPLAVAPAHQRQGLGSEIVRAGFATLEARQIGQVFVLGDPGYYSRLGFQPERDIKTPCPIPDEWAGAWQSLCLSGHAPLPAGTLRLPEPWMEPALWAP